jgi:hypothetical protein
VFGAGGAIQGASVLFSTTSGTLASAGIPVITDSGGTATDRLTTADDAVVTAEAPSPDGGGFVSSSVAIRVGEDVPSASLLLLSADPPSLPSGGGTTALTASVYDNFAIPMSGVFVTFSTTAGSLGTPTSVVTDADGNAANTLTTAETAEVTAIALPSTVRDTITVDVAGTGSTLTLTADRTLITTNTPPAPDPCVTGPNPDVPVPLRAVLQDVFTNPVAGKEVIFLIDEPASSNTYGQFCPVGGTPRAVTGASGEAVVLFTVTDEDVAYCTGVTPQCSTVFVARWGEITSNTVTIDFTP